MAGKFTGPPVFLLKAVPIARMNISQHTTYEAGIKEERDPRVRFYATACMPYTAHLLCLFLLLILGACAQEGAPPGGPPDTFAPYVVDLTPSDGTVQVPVNSSPVITFNERIDFRSLEDAVFVVPLIPFKFKSNWDGDEITLQFEEPLQQNKTYVITLGTTVRDLRNNRLTSAVVYAFSTGDLIDQGEITGVVALNDRPTLGAFVWAYNIRLKPEPDPAKIPPDYIVQSGEDGTFRFTNLSINPYRIFAFRDQGRDRRYDIGMDPLGLPTRDVILSKDQVSSGPLWLQLAVRDTVAMYISSARATQNNQVDVRLSKAVQAETASDVTHYHVVDTQRGEPLEVLTAYRNLPDSTSLTLRTASQTAGSTYRLTISDLRDYGGALIDTADNTADFTGSSGEDTVPPTLKTVSPANRSQNVPLQPNIVLTFNEPVIMEDNSITVVDTLDQRVVGTIYWPAPTVAVFRPEGSLAPNMQYTLYIIINRIRDLSGQWLENSNSESDSISHTFTTVDPNEYGVVSGSVIDEDSTTTGAIYISITNVLNRTNTYQTRIPTVGPYSLNQLMSGRYTLYAYRDANNNGRFDIGTVLPFIPAERAIAHAGTLSVRSSWELEGVDLRFRP